MQPRIAHNIIEVRHLVKNAGHPVEMTLSDSLCQDVRAQLDLNTLKKARFEGHIVPHGKGDWKLTAKLGATVEQACVVSQMPVSTRIDTTVERIFRRNLSDPDTGSELEMPEDVDEDQLQDTIDLVEVFTESLSLALPDYPRADGIETFSANYAGKDIDALTDESAKPFAGLAALKDKLS
ncbi:MAG: YceD family protein [Planktomarina sp.]